MCCAARSSWRCWPKVTESNERMQTGGTPGQENWSLVGERVIQGRSRGPRRGSNRNRAIDRAINRKSNRRKGCS